MAVRKIARKAPVVNNVKRTRPVSRKNERAIANRNLIIATEIAQGQIGGTD